MLPELSAKRRLGLRWALPALLLVAEVIGLSMRFDTASLSRADAWLTRFAGDIPALLRVAFAFTGAFLLLAPRLRTIGAEALRTTVGHRWLVGLLLHLAAFGAFFWTTVEVFDYADADRRLPAALLGFWVALAGLSLVLLLSTAAPPGFWFGMLLREKLPLAAAALAGTVAWLGGLLAQQFWQPLARGTFELSYGLLGLLYPDVLGDSSKHLLGTSRFWVQINAACSGYEGIALITVFLAIYLWVYRSEIRFPRAFLLFPIGALAIWLANVVRITLLILIGTSFSPQVALGGFHSQAGWMAFIAIALGLILAMRRLRLFAIPAQPEAMVEPDSIPSALLVPFLVLLAGTMLTSSLSAGFDRFYALRIVGTAVALWYFRDIYRRWEWRISWQAVAVGSTVFVMWILLEPPNETGLGANLATLPPGEAALWLVFRAVGSVLIVPLAEELAFRGYLLRKLAGEDFEQTTPPKFAWAPFLVTSVAFGLLHTRWLAGTLAGMAYAWVRYRHGRLADAIAAHMITNGLIALAVLIWGKWTLWS